jgi:hypothetical protein
MSKKESNYSHSPNGANGKKLPNYVNQAKIGAKLLQRNSNDGGQKSINNIDNFGPNNMKYGRFFIYLRVERFSKCPVEWAI